MDDNDQRLRELDAVVFPALYFLHAKQSREQQQYQLFSPRYAPKSVTLPARQYVGLERWLNVDANTFKDVEFGLCVAYLAEDGAYTHEYFDVFHNTLYAHPPFSMLYVDPRGVGDLTQGLRFLWSIFALHRHEGERVTREVLVAAHSSFYGVNKYVYYRPEDANYRMFASCAFRNDDETCDIMLEEWWGRAHAAAAAAVAVADPDTQRVTLLRREFEIIILGLDVKILPEDAYRRMAAVVGISSLVQVAASSVDFREYRNAITAGMNAANTNDMLQWYLYTDDTQVKVDKYLLNSKARVEKLIETLVEAAEDSEISNALSAFLVVQEDSAAAVKNSLNVDEIRSTLDTIYKLVADRILGTHRNSPALEMRTLLTGYDHIPSDGRVYWKMARDDVLRAYDDYLLAKIRNNEEHTIIKHATRVDPLAIVMNYNTNNDPVLLDSHVVPVLREHMFPNQFVTHVADGLTGPERHKRYYEKMEALCAKVGSHLWHRAGLTKDEFIHNGIITADTFRAYETVRTDQSGSIPSRLLPVIHPILQRPLSENKDAQSPAVLFATWIAGSSIGRKLIDSAYLLDAHLSCKIITQTPLPEDGVVQVGCIVSTLEATTKKLQPVFPDVLTAKIVTDHGDETAKVARNSVNVKANPTVDLPLDRNGSAEQKHVTVPLQYVLHFLTHILFDRAQLDGETIDDVIQKAQAVANGGCGIQTQKAHVWR